MGEQSLIQSTLSEWPLLSRGKVRDVYDLGKTVLIVATDRMSCFGVILPTAIPGKGRGTDARLLSLLAVRGSKPGRPQPRFDKQYVGDYLESIGWNKQLPALELPSPVVESTLLKYREALYRLTGTGIMNP